MSKKFTFSFVKETIKNEGFKLLSKSYKNKKEKLNILCIKCNYIWPCSFDQFRKSNCPECSKKRTPLYDEVSNIINNAGGKLLSKKYKNNYSKLKIECNICKNILYRTLSSIKNNGLMCKQCSKNRKIQLLISYVKSRGEVIDIKKINKRLYAIIKCNKCNNIVNMRYDNIKNRHWCIYCAGSKKHNINYVKQVISNMGGELLSKYKNNETKLLVKCNKCDHIWKPKFRDIARKDRPKWCPECALKKSQKLLYNIIKNIYNTKVEFDYKGFDWLKTKGNNKQEIDIFVPNIKLAIEYDGEQHFRPVCFGGMTPVQAEKAFKYIQKMDKIKNKKILKNNNDIKYFIRFSYLDKLNKNSVIKKLKDNNIPIKKEDLIL